MEAVTHNLTGIIIQIIFFKYFLFPLNIIYTIIFGIVSHIVLDILSKVTYHMPEAQWKDKFWLSWQIIIFIGTFVVIIGFLIPFWLGMLFANLPDIVDWRILRPIQNRKKRKGSSLNSENKYIFHPLISWIRTKFFFWLPNLNYKRYGVIVEISLIVLLTILIFYFI